MYRIAVCDDEQEYLKMVVNEVHHYCKEHMIDAEIKGFYDSDLLAEHIEKGKLFDLFILDIKMPAYTGMELANKIRRCSSTACVVFLTAYETFAVDAFRLDVCGYILKDQLDRDLAPVLNKVFRKCNEAKDATYLISNQRKYIKIFQKDILYIYKWNKNSVIVLSDGQKEWERMNLQDMVKRLKCPPMYVLDRGIIINLQKIQRIEGNQIIMEGGTILTSSSTHVKKLKLYLNECWELIF